MTKKDLEQKVAELEKKVQDLELRMITRPIMIYPLGPFYTVPYYWYGSTCQTTQTDSTKDKTWTF